MSSEARIDENEARGRSGMRIGGSLLAALLIAGLWLSLPGRAQASVASGALSQLAEPSSCIGEEESEVAKCASRVPFGLSFAYQIEVSPDGRNAYSVGVNGDLIEYSRDLTNGALSVIGCVSSRTSLEPCAGHNAQMEVAAVGDPSAIAISPDGRSVYVVGKLNNTIAEFERSTEAGEVGQLEKIGCITNEATLSECEATGAKGLFAPYGVTVSPEGENVYVAGFGEDAVAEFKRSGSGTLTQLAAPNECIGDAGSGCGTTAIGLKEDIGIQATSEDVYVAAGAKGAKGDVAALARGAEGALEQLPSPEGCISETLVPECTEGKYIRGMEDLVVSPDGKNVYASSFEENAVIELTRTATGALEQIASPNECVSATALTGCEKAEGISGAVGVAISADGTNLYASGQNEATVAAFERNSVSGALKQLANPCVTEQSSGCGGFDKLVGLDYPRRLTVSPDGTNVYVAGQEAHAVAELARTVTPKLSRINSGHGSPEGGEEVYVTGSGFAKGAKVFFGGVESEVVVTSASMLIAKSPAHAEGQVAVRVENEAGASAESSADHFTYTDKPIVAGLTPTVGDKSGGTTVTITGSELGSASRVDFGSTPASFTVSSPESITATSPPGTGTVDVTVQTPQGTSPASAADKFAYVHGTPQGVSGLFLSGYCESLGDSRVALEKGEESGGPGFAYENWACVEPDGTEVLFANTGPAPSLANACEVENPGKTVYAYPTDPNSAYSWGCYVIVPPGSPPAKEEGSGATIATNHGSTAPGPGSSVPPPQLAVTGNVAPVSGTVLVRIPGSRTFVPLSSLRQIPFGTVIEATHGHVSVTTTEPDGATQTGEFFEGEFVLKQERNGLVVAELTGGNFSVCPTARERAHKARATAARASGKHVVRKLWANAHGSFSTKGNYAAGAVQGTEWLTEDLCEGTLIRVTRDKVRVTNLVTHRHVEVTTGHKYLAKAP